MLFVAQPGVAVPRSDDALTPSSAGPASSPRKAPPPAFSGYSSFSSYKQHLAARAGLSGISPSTIDAVICDLALNHRVIKLDRAQPGSVRNPNANPPFGPYRRKHVTPELIAEGRAVYAANYSKLAGIRERTGVDPAIAISIFGHETRFGQITGNFDLLDALATLAYEGRRRAFFESEFLAALRLIDRGIPRNRLQGSWAGATGYPQFMPSAILRLAIDGDGDGNADIWTSQADALASIGNFLRKAGWRPNVPWGIAVRTPAGLDRAALRSQVVGDRCPKVLARHSRWLTMGEWRELGVAPLRRSLPDDEPASLLEPDGPRGTAYLLTSNYRTILAYNCSNFYALTVGLLADKIERR